jgi:PIN domain nuclease of toxin-antitoxin system
VTTHLFDTNAWLRVCERPEELTAPVRDLIARSREPFLISAISIWEVCLKVRKGKLTLSTSIDDWLRITLRPSFVQVIPLDAEIARAATELPGAFHEDPADRFIVATALRSKLTIITSDQKILGYPHVKSIW